MDYRWFSVLFFGCFAGAATFGGMYIVLTRSDWSRRNSAHLVSYAAGVLLGIGILHILPEANGLNDRTPVFFLIAFVLFYFLEHHIFFHAGHEQLHHLNLEIASSHEGCCANPHPLGFIAFAGMTLHSIIDGFIIGTGFEVSGELGFLSALAVIAHEVPEGVAIMAILLHYGYSRRSALLLASTVALATPLAAVVAHAIAREMDHFLLGALMALAAGSFVYIAASDLIPESHRARGLKGSLSLCGGILTAAAAGWIAH